MEDIYALLHINKGILQDFPLQAERAVDHQTELAINRDIRTLKDIEERMMTDKAVNVSQQSIDEIMLKVIDNAKTNNSDMTIWSIRELRIVSYYLMKLQGNDDAYRYALKLLNANWRDMFFNGLSFYCLDTWNLIDPILRVEACLLLVDKLKQYRDNNKKYLAMKNHANLFEEAGPKRLTALLCRKHEDVKEAPTYFNNKPSTLSQSYYSDVIINFFESNSITDLDYVEEILDIHKDDRTKKLVFADLVERLNNFGDEIKRTQLCKFANRILGDITLSSTWAPFAGATEKEAQKLKKAKQLVNLWFNQKIIETFFEVCVQDRDRKVFWLKYVQFLSGFKIVGSTAIKRLLQGDSRVNTLFLPHFIETDSRTTQTSALVLFIKNKVIIEFSDTGALYVYDQGHRIAKLVRKGRSGVSKIADLKIPSLNGLIVADDWGYYSYYEEGRMTHQGYWQDRLTGWLQQMVLSSNNTNISFFDSKDDDVFKAKPIKKESIESTKNIVNNKDPKDKSENKSNESASLNKHSSKSDGLSTEEIEKLERERMNVLGTNYNLSDSEGRSLVIRSVIYEKSISFRIASKIFCHDQCRIVMGYTGYYILLLSQQLFVQVRRPIPNYFPEGNIWIKLPNLEGWRTVIHIRGGIEKVIGYVKEVQGAVIYKQDLSIKESLKIYF